MSQECYGEVSQSGGETGPVQHLKADSRFLELHLSPTLTNQFRKLKSAWFQTSLSFNSETMKENIQSVFRSDRTALCGYVFGSDHFTWIRKWTDQFNRLIFRLLIFKLFNNRDQIRNRTAPFNWSVAISRWQRVCHVTHVPQPVAGDMPRGTKKIRIWRAFIWVHVSRT